MNRDFTVVVNAECGLMRSGPCMFSLWRGRPEIATVKRHYEVAEALCKRHPKFALMLVMESAARPPSAQAWRMIEDFYSHFGPRILCLAQVLEATGFASSAARAAMATILLRRDFPSKVFAKTSEAVPWVAKYLSLRPEALPTTGMMLASHVRRARLEHTWQPRQSIARVSVSPPRGHLTTRAPHAAD